MAAGAITQQQKGLFVVSSWARDWMQTLRTWRGSKSHRRRRKSASYSQQICHVDMLEDRTLLTAGMLDPSFGIDGRVTSGLNYASSTDNAESVLVQSDGKILVAGRASSLSFILRYHSDGSIDTSFADQGQLVFDEFGSMRLVDMAAQADGKLVLCGSIDRGNSVDFAVVRVHPDGTRDLTFGERGLQRVNFFSGLADNVAHSLAIQDDGRIVVGGYVSISYDEDFAIARLNTDGSLDTSFGDPGDSGLQLIDFNDGNDRIYDIVIQGDDDIVAAGYATMDGQRDFAVLRLNSDGTLDPSFGAGGQQTIDFHGKDDQAYGVDVQADGGVVLAGWAYDFNRNFASVRLTASGLLDTGFGDFGGQGRQSVDFGNHEEARTVEVLSDGRILLAGQLDGGVKDFAFLRLNIDGTVDTTFGDPGSNGLQTIDFANYENLRSVAIQSDGKVVATGFADTGIGYDVTTLRLNADGTLDSEFGLDGIVVTPLNVHPSHDYGQSINVSQDDGKTVVVGYSQDVYDRTAPTLSRYNVDGTLDSSFGDDGRLILTQFGEVKVFDVAVQSDGKFILAGETQYTASLSYGHDFAAIRLNSDGTVDRQFGDDGITVVDFFGNTDTASSVLIQSNGKILLAGQVKNDRKYDFGVVRLSQDGTLDTSFGDAGNQGLQTIDFAGGDDFLAHAAIQSDDQIVVVGYGYNAENRIDVAVARLNADGTLDTSFGDAEDLGLQMLDHSAGYDDVYEAAIQDDGKVVVLGRDFALRVNADGTLDTSFGNNGWQEIDFGSSFDFAENIAFQQDGKIVVAGQTHTAEGAWDIAVIRLNADGSIDDAFRPQFFDINQQSERAYGLEVLSDDRMILVGTTSSGYGGHIDVALLRLNSEGGLDSSFGTQGITTTDFSFSPSQAAAQSMSIQQDDGKIVAVGVASAYVGYMPLIARYNSDGSLDESFGDQGRVVLDGLGWFDVFDTAIQSNGKIILAGRIHVDDQTDFAVVRLNVDGSLDTEFGAPGERGLKTIDFHGQYDSVNAIKIQPDDKILLVGEADHDGYGFAAARLTADGTLDMNFGNQGLQTIDFNGNARAKDIAIQDDGKMVLVGTFADLGDSDFAAVRLFPDGTLDTSFGDVGNQGRQLIDIANGDDVAQSVALVDGKIIVAGYAHTGSNTDFAIIQLHHDGTLDTSFGDEGLQTVDFGFFDYVTSMAVQTGGQIVLAGYTKFGSSDEFAAARLNPDGTLDTGFANAGLQTIALGIDSYAQSVAIQSNGDLVLFGHTHHRLAHEFALVRLLGGNTPPIANAGGPYVTDESQPVTLDGSASSDNETSHGSLIFEWDLDYDGSAFDVDAVGETPVVSFPDNFPTRMIALRVTDSYGVSSISTTTLTVDNVAPIVRAIHDVVSGRDGQTASNSGTFQDVVVDAVVVTSSIGVVRLVGNSWAWSLMLDGSIPSQTVTITAEDKDGAQTTSSFYLAVNDFVDIIGQTSNGDWWIARSNGAGQLENQFLMNWNPNLGWIDTIFADVNGDHRNDVIRRNVSGDIWVGVSTTSGYQTEIWGQWETGDWRDVQPADVNGDGLMDIVGRKDGVWQVAVSNGTSFTNQAWGYWVPGLTWNDVSVADVNGDGLDDIVGRANGGWWVALSDGSRFTNQLWGYWVPGLNWQDVHVADVNGDGRDDIVGRANGSWWVALSDGQRFTNQLWGYWVPGLIWQDVNIADVNGDGRDDIVGRANGNWWVSVSTGTSFTNQYWGYWDNSTKWDGVSIADVNGDGRDDIIGRANGNWWVAASTGANFNNQWWGYWVDTLDWDDVHAGFFS